MGFDTEKFKSSRFNSRTEAVAVPELSPFFEEGEDAVFTVRNLDGQEFGQVLDAVNRYKGDDIRALVQAVSGGETEEIAEGVKAFADKRDAKMPDETIRRSYMIKYGCVSPGLDMDAVKKIRRINADVFYRLSEKIKTLTAMGSELGE